MFRCRGLTVFVAVSLLCGACSPGGKSAATHLRADDAGADASASSDAAAGVPDDASAGDAAAADVDSGQPVPLSAGGSIGQLWVTDAKPKSTLTLLDSSGSEVTRGVADRLGSFIFRGVAPGKGYTVRGANATTKALQVLSQSDVPKASLYTSQQLHAGLNYVTMRDGIELAMTVRLPSGKTLADGPFATIVEYSGYQVAAPGDLVSAANKAIAAGTSLDSLTDPLLPATSTVVGSLIAPMLGYAAVSVQMRGSGCSGGDFQLFDVPSTFDGYDAVEVVAAQSWVKGNKVGLAGISFSGISQLFVAGTRPPHLAAIAPMSVTDDLYTGTGFPGGIFNDGFAKSWLDERQKNALPAPEAGAQPYAIMLVQAGDVHCKNNQKLRAQTQDLKQLVADNPFRVPQLADDRAPATWADKIKVPVFLVGQFQDEKTGGHFPEMLHLLDANPNVWISLQNGVNADALEPATFSRWVEFLDLFVGARIPSIPTALSTLSVKLYKALAGGSLSEPIPATRFDAFTNVAKAQTEFKKDPRVRVLFDSGAGALGPGALQPTWELGFDAWPVTSAVATTYYTDSGGVLTTAQPVAPGENSYLSDPSKRPLRTLGVAAKDDPSAALPSYDWTKAVDGASLGFSTPPLTQDTLVVGASSLDLMLKSSAADTDLQVTLSDVRSDGQEMYVQSGWLRASHRVVDSGQSTANDPIQLHLKADATDLTGGTFEAVRVQIYAVAHAFRAGDRIRVTIQAPGGERPRWTFDTIEDGTITNTVQLGTSKLVLPIVMGVAIPTSLPACPSNRGQPCRTYAAASNGG